MDIIAAYREVGTYRGAAAICGTTPQDGEAGDRARTRPAGPAPAGRPRGRNYDEVARAGRRAGRRRPQGGSRRSGCCRRPGRRAMRGRRGTSGGWSRTRRRRGAGTITVAGGRRCGRRVSSWSSTGASLGGLHVFCAVLAWSRVPVRALRRQRARRHDAGAAGGVLRGPRRGPEGGAGRPDGLPEGRGGREHGGAHRRTTCGSPPTTGSGPTSARPPTRSRRGSWRTWSATPRPT